ncbi:phosphohistidine phosphatase, SixA [Pseudomonas syringae]|jgi:phosphohistidine phosphatase|uniref:phosphohistidine phosphatase SixA n=1 Tax=Pseudomonas TaxID=286 RepID=UPI0007317B27|nr:MULTISPECIES: phosphohistidine phosphatase SixA [Pseudomonas]KTC06892.1 phosphohistidine phosphatase [Pseudomonas syringae ICMP 11168]MBP1086217.1 phosphohistidine phosphatase [Pseudomonas sp. PvP007]MBP1140958.1 phosphohistidine phosphatase [Pseudomonas sp. PvP009]MBP1192748.1 phosphohistidine phosphatase [Pseudomonas sp. PvP100]MCF5736546.1 phosphohistidine phosphatase SixA [Pseudomonas syringae]
MKVWVLRHGEAQSRARSDAERELTAHGREEVLKSALQLTDKPVRRIIASPYVRAQQTAELVRQSLAFDGSIVTAPWLTPESSPLEVLAQLDKLGIDEVLLVSHQPLVGELIGVLAHGSPRQAEPMSTASLAELEGEFVVAGGMRLNSVRHV